ncbi:lysosomal Pro-X carboxypeptidase-like [Pollicipes pollicipes]|uniref:lysosomal Pro-X carboxypeptidase-like n=1 Tax=Pollicipes pollicipes TaxID=41117 RepID=UPI0018856C6B|nr:lysosomal Pro-X carboxypeptidase-like [Pollicipes pollicipes]
MDMWTPLLLALLGASRAFGYGYEEHWFTTQVDHFSFANNDVFKMRYLVNDSWWDGDGGPIFFYTGNEGDIELFLENTGAMFDIAPEFGALVVFAEHRYYGQSQPYPNVSLSDPARAGFLTSEQALADYADLLTHLRATLPGAQASPVITFGGSYGGMLAAWFRVKYPHVVQGAIASSAPILQFTGITPCEAFGQVVTRTFGKEGDMCPRVIRKSWDAIDRLTADQEGMDWLSDAWNLCSPLNSSQLTDFKQWLNDMYTNFAMIDYPYPASFLSPLPGYPVKVACSYLHDDHGNDDRALLTNIYDVINLYFNYTGAADCVDTGSQGTSSLGDDGWDFQACTEMVMPMCYDGVADMFAPSPWNLAEYTAACRARHNVQPRPLMAPLLYGGLNITGSSNIVFANGLLDPWSSGGVLRSLSDSLVAVIIPNGAHHLDLRGSNPADPPDVIEARRVQREFIGVWIKQYEKVKDRNAFNAAKKRW